MALVEKSGLDAAEVSALTGLCIDDLATPDRELDELTALHAADALRINPWDIWTAWNPSPNKAKKDGQLGEKWVSEHDKGVSMT